MIEKEFIAQKTREFYIQKHVEETLGNVGISNISLKKIPLGEKIVIETSRPSLIVGLKGSNIKTLTKSLQKKFNLENPQIEINEVKNIFLDANIVAERIVSSLERFGSARFKGVGHKMLENVMNAGALGVEVIISGKIPGARAKNWRFYMGYLKKCGDVAISGVRKAKKAALLKSGIIGIKVSIMPPDVVLPDNIQLLDEPKQLVEEVQEEKKAKKKSSTVKKSTKRKSTKKKETAEKEASKKKEEYQKAGETVEKTVGEKAESEVKEGAQTEETPESKAEEPVKESEELKAEEKEELAEETNK